MNEQKKWELLKFAYDNYPKGTIVNFHGKNAKFELNGKYSFDEYGDIIDGTKRGVYLADRDVWAEIVSDKKPLLVSEDGVELFKGDMFFAVVKYSNGQKWREDFHRGNGYVLGEGSAILKDDVSERKAFSTKESAEKWIEEQTPKEIEFQIGNVKCLVTSNGISFDKPVQFLMESSIKAISNALKTLSK